MLSIKDDLALRPKRNNTEQILRIAYTSSQISKIPVTIDLLSAIMNNQFAVLPELQPTLENEYPKEKVERLLSIFPNIPGQDLEMKRKMVVRMGINWNETMMLTLIRIFSVRIF